MYQKTLKKIDSTISRSLLVIDTHLPGGQGSASVL